VWVQLRHAIPLALLLSASPAWADDRVDTTVTWFQEGREGGRGGLSVIHPQMDIGIDAGKTVTVNAGYDADIVTGATMAIYSVDAVSTATTFSDVRHSGHVSLGFRGRRSSLEVGFTHGRERDYRSYVATAGGTVDLPGKNTTLSLSYSHNFDFVCDRNNGDATEYERQPLSGTDECFTGGGMTSPTVTRDISIDTTQAALTQNVTPTFVVQLGVHGQVIRGFQSNPYRRVRVAEFDAQENSPLIRARGALFARGNIALPRLASAIGFTLRGYSDTWGVNSLSIEADYSQYLGKHVLFRLRGRGYEQTGATFFQDAEVYRNNASPGRYFTGDRELAPMRTYLAGGRLSYIAVTEEGRPVWGWFDEVSLNLKADALWSDVLTPTPPGGDISGVFPEAFIFQFGLLLRY
jgi:hypothetical protein